MLHGLLAGASALLTVAVIALSVQLGNAREAMGEAQGNLDAANDSIQQIAGINQQLKRDLIETRDLHSACLDDRAADREAAQQALVERERESRRRAEEARSARAELERLYAGDCEAWAGIPACPEAADFLRARRSGRD